MSLVDLGWSLVTLNSKAATVLDAMRKAVDDAQLWYRGTTICRGENGFVCSCYPAQPVGNAAPGAIEQFCPKSLLIYGLSTASSNACAMMKIRKAKSTNFHEANNQSVEKCPEIETFSTQQKSANWFFMCALASGPSAKVGA